MLSPLFFRPPEYTMYAIVRKGGFYPMLDRTLPYFDVIMVRPGHFPQVQAPALPRGYRYRLYRRGDIHHWSAIQTAVAEFDQPEKAAVHFQKEFLSDEAELARRMVFIDDSSGRPVADAAAWWKDDEACGRVALLHWVAVHPDRQGLGLGRAVSSMALSLFASEGPTGDIWLTTQTWSHVAIGLYLSLGFCAHRSHRLGGHANGFAGAVNALQDVLPPAVFAQFVDTSIG